MDGSPSADDFLPAGLSSYGIEADEIELVVLGAIHQLFWPPILELLDMDLGEAEPERDLDLSRAP
ncbi:MAG TPA: hypothetical protein VGB06_04175 [Solirubrobacterales bacterium]|jgi:hypothetical protein